MAIQFELNVKKPNCGIDAIDKRFARSSNKDHCIFFFVKIYEQTS